MADLLEIGARWGRAATELYFRKRGKGERRVEVHLSQDELAAALGAAYAQGIEDAGSCAAEYLHCPHGCGGAKGHAPYDLCSPDEAASLGAAGSSSHYPTESDGSEATPPGGRSD